jgi:hypothetical protein
MAGHDEVVLDFLFSQRCALVLSPRFGRGLIALNAEQAYAPTIPSAHRLQLASSTFTNAAVTAPEPRLGADLALVPELMLW